MILDKMPWGPRTGQAIYPSPNPGHWLVWHGGGWTDCSPEEDEQIKQKNSATEKLEIVIVPGRGLCAVHSRGDKEGRPFVSFVPHGHPTNRRVSGAWVGAEKTRLLSISGAREAIAFERAEATPRGVGCDALTCWCRIIVP